MRGSFVNVTLDVLKVEMKKMKVKKGKAVSVFNCSMKTCEIVEV